MHCFRAVVEIPCSLVKSQQSLKLRILDYIFYVFFWKPLQKNVKSRVFLDFEIIVKNVFSNYGSGAESTTAQWGKGQSPWYIWEVFCPFSYKKVAESWVLKWKLASVSETDCFAQPRPALNFVQWRTAGLGGSSAAGSPIAGSATVWKHLIILMDVLCEICYVRCIKLHNNVYCPDGFLDSGARGSLLLDEQFFYTNI